MSWKGINITTYLPHEQDQRLGRRYLINKFLEFKSSDHLFIANFSAMTGVCYAE